MTDLISREAALTACLQGKRCSTDIIDAIRALPVAQVKVKPLVWECDARWPSTVWSGGYQINDQDENEWLMTTPQGDSATFETIDAAKAAAQADYEARILATLDLSPTAVDASQTPDPVINDPRVKALVEQVRALLDAADGESYAAYNAALEATDAALRAIGGEA